MQHVTKAAKSLSITQPALSRSIARLENHLGVPLFDRHGRSITLNQYGHIFLRRVQAMMKEYTEGKEEIQALLKPDQGEVSLGFLHTLGTTLVPDLIGSFQQEYPNIAFQLKQNHSYWLLERLKSGDLDLCLLASIKPEKPIQWIKLWSEELFVFVPDDHFAQPAFAIRSQNADSFQFAHVINDTDTCSANRFILMINEDVPAIFTECIELIEFIGNGTALFLYKYCLSDFERCM